MKTKLTKLKAQFEALGKEIKRLEQPTGVYRPKEGDEYWCINLGGNVFSMTWENEGIDQKNLALGSVYRTKELAQAHVAYLTALTTIKHYIADNDLGLVADWSDNKQHKHYIYYAHSKKEFWTDQSLWSQTFSPFGYLKSKEACEELIKACQSELMTVLRYE